ncbi:MAG: NAD(P)-dependent oxidoreductase [Schleiferiaceae bacterium]|nr:NAD(P)-dependent oxidoreductase [Schleiferiaceae bacterium]
MKRVLAIDSTDAGLESGLESAGFTVLREYQTSEADLGPSLAEVQGLLLRSRIRISSAFLERAPQLKWIGRLGSGVENIDHEAAKAQGIRLFSAPEGNRTSLGEHAMGMLLALAHRIVTSNQEVLQGEWNRASNTGWELEGSTVGIIGFGHMGSAFAQRLQGFGVRILAYDKYKTGYAPSYVSECSLKHVLAQSDVLSFHLPLTEETQGFVKSKLLGHCSNKPILLNTSRGAVIRTKDVWEAIQSGQLRGAALDVVDVEKRSLEGLEALPAWWKEFIHDPRVLITPHIAGWSEQSFPKMGQVLLRKILHEFA